MSRVTTIHHVNLQISDREQTREWYEKVLGAEFLDRSPALNKGQLQLRLGNAEIHTNDTKEPVRVPGVHFAVEIDDWDEMIAHLIIWESFTPRYRDKLRARRSPGGSGTIPATTTATYATPTGIPSRWSTILWASKTPSARK